MNAEPFHPLKAEPRHQLDILICLLLVAGLLSVYLPVVWFDFTNYDDPAYVLENVPVLNGLTWQGLQWAFTHSHSANWHPLTWLSHMLDCQLYGLKPAGHHVTSLLFHAANTLLLFGLLRFMTRALWRSACVAGLFALHPLHVESVAWIAERKDVLSAFFGLLSLWAYAAYVRVKLPTTHSRHFLVSIFYSLSLLLFVFGLMSKAMLVTWPFVLLLLDFWPLRRFQLGKRRAETPHEATNNARRTLLWEKLPFFALSATACIITIMSQKGAAALAPLAAVPLGPRVLNAIVSCFLYLAKLFWPGRLAVIYLDTGPPRLTLVLLGALVLSAVSLLAWRFREQRPHFLAGWAWYLGTLVPVIGLVKVGNQSMADRYTYLPAIGLFVMVAWGIGELAIARSAHRAVTAVAAVGLFMALAIVTQHQVLSWQNTETLFRHALTATKNNYVAYNSLGFYYADLGESRQAQRIFSTSLAIHPNNAAAWNKLGSVLINQGQYDKAAATCQMALQLNPRMAEAHTTLGLALMKQGKTNEALACYSEALRFQPEYAPAHYNLANALVHQGRFDLAREHYEASLRADPRSGDAHNNLAYILAREQRFDEAISHFRLALHFQPRSWQAHYGLGELLAKQSRLAEASAEFSNVLRLKPDLALAHFQHALVLARQGKTAAALDSAGQAHLLASQNGQEELARKSQQLQERLRSP